jgi:hypothetical protein
MPVSLWNHSHPGIYIEGDTDFFRKASVDLNELNSEPVGRDLLKLISKRCQGIGATASGDKVLKVVIALAADVGSTAESPESFVPGKDALTDTRKSGVLPGSVVRMPVSLGGTGSYARYMPDGAIKYALACKILMPPYIALGHELVHSFHSLNGDYVKDYSWSNGTATSSSGAIIEEARTVGLGRYANTRFSENALRKEHGYALRTFYSSPGDCDNIQI